MQIADKIKRTIRDVVDYPRAGIVFKDITPVLADAGLVSEILGALHEKFKSEPIDGIAAIEARGFIFGALLAHTLNRPFIPIRKSGKLPYKTLSQEYALEYGKSSVEIHTDAFRPGSKILIHDDLLATGGTAIATANLIKKLNGEISGFSFLINLGFLPGEQNIISSFGVKPTYLVSY